MGDQAEFHLADFTPNIDIRIDFKGSHNNDEFAFFFDFAPWKMINYAA